MKPIIKRFLFGVMFSVLISSALAIVILLVFPALNFVVLAAISTSISIIPGIKTGDLILKKKNNFRE